MPSNTTKKRRILGATVLALAVLLPSLGKSESDSKKPGQTKKPRTSVVLTVDYGDGAQKRFPSIPWKPKMTVLDGLKWAARHPRGIQFERRGSDATAMVTQIDDVKNGGGNAKNWIFQVNGQLGQRSSGVSVVKAGDRILWKFDRYR